MSPTDFGALLTFLVLNLVILGYAVHTTDPAAHDGALATQAPSPGSSQGDAIVVPKQAVTQVDLPTNERVDRTWLEHCAACHGIDGRGDGPAAEQLFPRPRDFKNSPLRFASTGGSRFDVLTAIEGTIGRGVARSAMPGFHGVLSESEIAGLARKVLDLRGEAVEEAAVVLDLGPRPPFSPELKARGQHLYAALGCVTCHGETGRGDGPAAKNLRDSVGRPLKAADLASGLFKSGQSEASLARTILKGVPGTPMAAYEAALVRPDANGVNDTTDAWALVAYVRDFQRIGAEVGEASGARIVAHRVDDRTWLADPGSVRWIGIRGTAIEVHPLWQRVDDLHALTVRAARTANEVVLCFEWQDSTIDLVHGEARWPDGVAVMLAADGKVPPLPMGVSLPGLEPSAPVNVWHWRADRQIRAIADLPDPWVDFEPPVPGETFVFVPGSTQLPRLIDPNEGMTYDAHADDSSFRTARVAENVSSTSDFSRSPAVEAVARGFGTLSPQPEPDQDLAGAAVWSNGMWRVVVRRPWTGRGADDVKFDPAVNVPVAFALWNGAKGDRAGVKQISGWHWLVLDETGGKP